ncbi:MAG: ABC transporter ATP-binding protein, partial [Spirochaetota bacterium]
VEIMLVAGKNGSGKTVLMYHLNGLLIPTRGEVVLEGFPIRKNLLLARQKVGLVFQNARSQIVGQTVEDDVAFGPRNLGLPENEIEERVKTALEACGLGELAERRPHFLSGGELKRLAIAGVLAMKPKILVLDEPFSDLDYPGVRQVIRYLLKLHAEGHTLIVISHELDKFLAHATRLIIMEKGEIVRDGRPEDLIHETEAFGIRGLQSTFQGITAAGKKAIELMTWLR